MVNENSLKAYAKIKPELTQREQEVLDVIKRHPNGITCYEVAGFLKKYPNQISGRFKPLEDKGFIINSGKRSGHDVWKYLMPDGQLNLL